MNDKVDKLDLKKYLPFFKMAKNNDSALLVYNLNGDQLLSTSFFKSKNLLDYLHSTIPLAIDWEKISSAHGFSYVDKSGFIKLTKLNLGAENTPFWLLGCCITDTPLDKKEQNSISQYLTHTAHCLNEDYLVSKTVTGMADELAVRYEELNLLYGIDDVDTYYKNNDEQDSLNQLISNCVEYLNIDLGVIYLPGQNLYLSHLGWKSEKIDQDDIKLTISSKLYPYLLTHKKTLVINHDDQIDWTDEDLHIPYKLIAVPIVKTNQQICGILVLINQIQKTDFSNSDRKLTEVLTTEASKLIQVRRDPTTGELNRRGFNERLEKQIKLQQIKNTNSCLLFLDIDQFRLVNETAGQTGGDLLLKQISTLLHKSLKKTDVLSRLGSDEFAIILNNNSLSEAELTANRIRLLISQFRFIYQTKMYDLSACIGIVELNHEIKNSSQILSAADLACSIAKEQGRNRVHTYKSTDEVMLKHENQMQWVSRINDGIEQDKFLIYRQPIQLLQEDPELEEHYEILVRLQQGEKILSPDNFIPAAERYNLMPKLDKWVIKNTLSLMAEELKLNPDSKLLCSINLSGQSFCEEGFILYIQDNILRSGVPPTRICFEMTETAAVSNLSQAVDFMETLKKIGCQFSLDDFGSGMSSFTYLKNLPVNYLKIDGYFVKTLLENKIDHAMVSSIHQIGNVMGLKTIAEFVENEETHKELKKIGIDYVQGSGVGKPQPFIIPSQQ